jgi:hypothetical protein
MNHTNLLTIGMIVGAATLIGAVGISVLSASALLSTNPTSADPSTIDIEKSTTDFNFKQKQKNNCSGFSGCSNAGTETFAGV